MAERAKEIIPSKRNILSILAGLFDPLGSISPIVVCAKLLFRELCIEKSEWDNELKGDNKTRWERRIVSLERVRDLVVARCVYGNLLGKVKCYKHGYADARQKAYF